MRFASKLQSLRLWDVKCQMQRMGIEPILCVYVQIANKNAKKTHSVNGPLVLLSSVPKLA